jgi:hypothetical protein
MRVYTLQVKVKAPDGVEAQHIKGMLQMLIDVGQADANDTLDEPEMSDDVNALLATQLEVEVL